jgi:hypothetical protein
MTTIQKLFFALFVLFLAAIPVWSFVAVPEFLKLPGDYGIKYSLISSEETRYDIGSEWTEKTLLKGIVDIGTTNVVDDRLYLDGVFHIEYLDGLLSYETKENHIIERKSKQASDGSFFLFPRKLTQQEDPSVIFPGWNFPLTMMFENRENVNGLDVFKFKSTVRNADLTESFEFLDLVPEQYLVTTDADGRFWVEPTSGIIVKYEEDGVNYYLQESIKNRVQSFSTFSNKFSDDTIANQVRIAQNEKQKIQLYERWIPVLFGLVSLAFLIALFASRKVVLRGQKS